MKEVKGKIQEKQENEGTRGRGGCDKDREDDKKKKKDEN